MKFNAFHTHHAPWGAYASFVLGKPGDGGGFAMNDVRCPHSDIYLGYKTQGEFTNVMPFCEVKENDFEEAFGIGKIGNEKWIKKVKTIGEEEYERTLTTCTDSWNYNGLSFTIYSPFLTVPQLDKISYDDKKKLLVPGIIAELTFDNMACDKNTTVFFGMNDVGRLIGDHSKKLYGGAAERTRGFACEKAEDIVEYIGMNAIASIVEDTTHRYKLGNNVMVKMVVPPHQKKTITIALATYQDGYITSGIDMKYAYTEYFENLEDVFEYLLTNKEYYKDLAIKRDEEINNVNLPEVRKHLLAHAYHSYLASTQLMVTKEKELFWNVNEGEYRMMNTLDLTIDHMFYELNYHPWTIKNTLDFFWNYYSYKDDIVDMEGNVFEGGLSFSHDCGMGNMFSAPGSSSYEVDQAVGCFSYMTMEELLNWSICATVYGIKNGSKEEKFELADRLKECLNSIKNRDKNKDGVMDCDSTKAKGHSEITTYDSLDHSLAQARNNLYTAVKTWSAFVCMGRLYEECNYKSEEKECKTYATLAAKTITEQYDDKKGYIPSIFDKQDTSRIIPAIEALIYPYELGMKEELTEDGCYGELIQTLKKHFMNIMKAGICVSDKNGGWKLTSSNTNTWMSKIYICQYVAEKILQIDLNALTPNADEAHLTWQLDGCSSWCAVDQVNCETGFPIGSRLYPRLVTSVLWLS